MAGEQGGEVRYHRIGQHGMGIEERRTGQPGIGAGAIHACPGLASARRRYGRRLLNRTDKRQDAVAPVDQGIVAPGESSGIK